MTENKSDNKACIFISQYPPPNFRCLTHHVNFAVGIYGDKEEKEKILELYCLSARETMREFKEAMNEYCNKTS